MPSELLLEVRPPVGEGRLPGRKVSPPRRMSILMVAARYFPFAGGTETHVHEVSKRMAAAGHAVEILTADPSGKLPKEEFASGVRVVRASAWPRGRDYYFAPGIPWAINRGNWDLIHIQGYHTLVAPLAMLAAIKRSIPFAITFHSGGHSSRLRNAMREPQRAVLRPLVRRAAQLIGVSQFEADFFSATMRLPRDRFSVIPNGAELPKPSPQLSSLPRGRLILSIGRLERYKGHHRAIEAFGQVLRRCPDAHLMILGHGPYERPLRRLIAKHGLEDSITIESIPTEKRDRLAAILANAALVVLLSEYEAHPVAVTEALSCGRRVLVNYAAGLKEVADSGFARSVPPNATSSEVAEAMLAELSAAPLNRGMGLASWDDCAQRLLETYKKALAASSR